MLKIKTTNDKLLGPLQQVTGIVERRHTLPILSNVLISASEGNVDFLATDLEVQITSRASLGNGPEGSVTAAARKLYDILRSLPEDAEVSLMRLDELMHRFQAHGERAAVERVLNVARLGKRRAEMIARNVKVEPQKREEKLEIANWFRIWLETPDAFFDWLDVRKQSPEFQAKFPQAESEV